MQIMANNNIGWHRPDMSSTGRHGYAIFVNAIMISWVMSTTDIKKIADVEKISDVKVVNVQNGAVLPAYSSTRHHKLADVSSFETFRGDIQA